MEIQKDYTKEQDIVLALCYSLQKYLEGMEEMSNDEQDEIYISGFGLAIKKLAEIAGVDSEQFGHKL